MREILFRGKSIEPSTEGKWWYGSLLVHGSCYYILPENPITPLGIVKYRVDPETVGQLWMRICDLKLFDGDVFDFPKYEVRFVIQFNARRSQFCIAHPEELNLKYINPWQCPDEKWIEEFMKDAVLVGNIHDNKELPS